MKKAIYASLVALMVIGCSSSGSMGSSAANPDKTYTLALNPKEGQTYNYDMSLKGKAGNGQDIQMDISMSMLAEKVEGDKITMKTTVNKTTMNGQDFPLGAGQSTEQVLDKHGKLISQSGNAGQQGPMGSNLPENPIKVGDSWSTTFQGVNSTSKLVSVDNEGGKQVGNLEVMITGNGKVSASKPGHVKVDMDTGMTISAEMSGIQAAGGTMDMTMKMTN